MFKNDIASMSDVKMAQNLLYCLENKAPEDALGWILELLARLRKQKGYQKMSVKEMNKRWDIA